MVDDWYDDQTLSTLGCSESNISEYTEKKNIERKTKYSFEKNSYDGSAISGLGEGGVGRIISHNDLVDYP